MLVPEAIRYQQYVDWVDNLPVIESPSWSGLPNSVEKVMKESNTEKMLFELWNIQDAGEEEITVIEIPPELLPQQESERGGRGMNRGGRGAQDEKPKQMQWLIDTAAKCEKFLGLLPNTLSKLPRTQDSINDPLFRFLEREVTVAS
jgi:dynein heavy chain 1, cytosolic